MPSQIGIRTGPSLAPEAPVAAPPPGGSAPGRLQGRDVERLPAAQTITRAPSQSTGSAAERPGLHERQPVQQSPQYQLIHKARLSGLEGADVFTAKAGRPKEDISFGMLGKYHRDEGYKAVIKGMKTYEAAGAPVSSSGPQALKGLDQMRDKVTDLALAVDRYQATDTSQGGVRKEAFVALGLQLQNEMVAINQLVEQLRQGASLPEGASLADAVAFAREGVSLKDMATLMERGLDSSQAKEGREFIDNQRAIAVLDDPAKMARYEAQGFDRGDVFLLKSAGHGMAVGEMYKDMRVAITHQTIVTGLVENQVQGTMKKLGSGAFNSVFATNFATPDGVLKGAFKPLQKTEHGWVASRTGIDGNNPQIVMRNLATGDVARQLGFNVVVKTQLGLCTTPAPKGQPATAAGPLQLGMVMARAEGAEAHKTEYGHFKNGDVQREVTKLQLLDHLVGQGDRHGGNYFISVAANGHVVVAGIDNDQCFGHRLTDPNGIRNKTGDTGFVNSRGTQNGAGVARPQFDEYGKDKAGNSVLIRAGWNEDGFRGTNMPPVIDTEMAAALRSLTPETLDKLLGERMVDGVMMDGKLTQPEVGATKARLTAMLAHVDQLEANGRVIDPSRWGETDVNAIILADPNSSYVARDHDRAWNKALAAGEIY
ncbi:MAG: hypothetical protein K9J76_10775 [Polaromonas sp.]|nr:hypothetical protein [Polaromonas sp.]